MRLTTLPLAACLLGACGNPASAVKPDEASVTGHRREAARERVAADEDRQPYEVGTGLNPAIVPDPARAADSGRRPSSGLAAEAEWHRAHAAAHEAAALELERFEASECKEIEARVRAGCPLLGPAVRIEDVPQGVRVVLAASVSAPEVVRRMRCHYAFARARGFGADVAACPLYIRGIDIGVADGNAVRIVGSTPQVVAEIQKRARQTALPARPSAP